MHMHSQVEHSDWSSPPAFRPRQLPDRGAAQRRPRGRPPAGAPLNRAMHGFGVVEGFGLAVGADGKLDLTKGCLELTGGLALDRYGRMLYWKGGRMGIHDLVGRRRTTRAAYTLSRPLRLPGRPPTDECHPIAGGAPSGAARAWPSPCIRAAQVTASAPTTPRVLRRPRPVPCRRTGRSRRRPSPSRSVRTSAGCCGDRAAHCPPGPAGGVRRAAGRRPDRLPDDRDLADPNASPRLPTRGTVRRRGPRVLRGPPSRVPQSLALRTATAATSSSPDGVDLLAGLDRPGWKHRSPWPDFARRRISDRTRDDDPVHPAHQGRHHPPGQRLPGRADARADSDYWERHRCPTRLDPLEENEALARGVALDPTAGLAVRRGDRTTLEPVRRGPLRADHPGAAAAGQVRTDSRCATGRHSLGRPRSFQARG